MKSGWRVRRSQARKRVLVQVGTSSGPGADASKTQQIRGLVQVVKVDRAPESLLGENTGACPQSAVAGENAKACLPHGYSFRLDRLDRLDQGSKSAGFLPPSVGTTPGPPGPPPWHDDRAWLALWHSAGPTLAEREPALRAWLAVAPPEPLPRGLAVVELRRIARNHGIVVEVAP